MKTRLTCILIAIQCAVPLARGQGTFVFDQQSVPFDYLNPEAGFTIIQQSEPMGQSFTPTLSSVDFIRLAFFDPATPGDSLNGTLYLNLRADSITGPILASTDPVTLPPNVVGYFTNFFFSTPVPVTPGVTYYFQPAVVSGNLWGIHDGPYAYPGGSAYFNGVAYDGTANPDIDLVFREGVVVPEPSSPALLLVGLGVLGWCRHKRHGRQ